MLIVISPAKTLDYDSAPVTSNFSKPDFVEQSTLLVERLRELTPPDIEKLMGISQKLADLNFGRYLSWDKDVTTDNAKQAVLAFKGDVYAGLEAETFSEQDFDYAQDHLRILSGLYGLLKPLDLMQPYRLEMGTKISNPGGNNLYEFWGDRIVDAINAQMQSLSTSTLVNLASNEYFKSVNTSKLAGEIVTPVFKDAKAGNYKIISFYAKKARGLMSAWVIKNRISEVVYYLVSLPLGMGLGFIGIRIAMGVPFSVVYSMMPAGQVRDYESMYDPANRALGRERNAGDDLTMFGFYISNNIGIGFQTFASGILFGIGAIFFLVYNGLAIGATAGYLTQAGYLDTFYPFVVGHSSFELLAIAFCGAAGLKLGFALLSPGSWRRSDALKRAAKDAVQIVYGAALMLLIAAFIEAFWSSSAAIPIPVNRRLFGEDVSLSQTWKAMPKLFAPQWFQWLTWRRLSPTRSHDLPITCLERLKGAQRSRRISVLHMTSGTPAMWLTVLCYHLEEPVGEPRSYLAREESKDLAEDVLAGEDFSRTREVSGWRFKESDEEADLPDWLEKFLDWLESIFAFDGGGEAGSGSFLSWLNLVVKILLIAAAVAAAAWILTMVARTAGGKGWFLAKSKQIAETPEVLFGLDVRPESMPDDVLTPVLPRLEYYTDTIDLGFSTEAYQNPYLAAQQYLQKLGKTASSSDSLESMRQLPDIDTALVIDDISQVLSEERTYELLEWVRSGGRLVMGARGLEAEDTDYVLEAVGLEVIETDCDCRGFEEELAESIENLFGRRTADKVVEEADDFVEEINEEAGEEILPESSDKVPEDQLTLMDLSGLDEELQAALLEVMQERQVTIEGESLSLPAPFLVLATQNPIEQEGTYPLPEAELDRFLLKVSIDYPENDSEVLLTKAATEGGIDNGLTELEANPPMTTDQIGELQNVCAQIPVAEAVVEYAVRLARATRDTAVPGDLRDQDQTIFEFLAANENTLEYSTALFGKWHIGGGSAPETDPIDNGIPYFAGSVQGNISSYDSWNLTIDSVDTTAVTTTSTEYATSRVTALAEDWIADQSQPWFAWLAYNAPHSPFHWPDSSLHTQGAEPTGGCNIAANRRDCYLAMVEAMDTEIGNLLDSLSDSVRENTLVIFVGDNGSPANTRDTAVFAANEVKGSLQEGGIRVPMFVSGAEVSRIGDREARLVTVTDIYATIAELAGSDTRHIYDSLSLASYFSSDDGETRTHAYSDYLDGALAGWTVRNHDHQLINIEGAETLYALDAGTFNRVDVTGIEPDVLYELQVEAAEVRGELDQITATPQGASLDISDDGSNRIFTLRASTCARFVKAYTASATNIAGTPGNAADDEIFASDMSLEVADGVCTMTTNNMPNHDLQDTDVFANPVSAQNFTYEIPAAPQVAASATALSLNRLQGVFLNGVKIDIFAAACLGVADERTQCGANPNIEQVWRFDPLFDGNNFREDSHNAHTQPSGAYHYHGDPHALYDETGAAESGVIGFAADGFPIFGSFIREAGTIREVVSSYQLKPGSRPVINIGGSSADYSQQPYDGAFREDYEYVEASGDLDECNGMWQDGVYGYYVTENFPYVLGCYTGTPDPSF
eukprot:g4530.t1